MTQMLCLLHYLITHVTPFFFPKLSWLTGAPMLPPARHAARSQSKAQATFRTHQDHGAPLERPAILQDTPLGELRGHGPEGSKSLGRFCTKKNKILLGRKMRHRSKDSQAEGNAGACTWMCLKPAGLERSLRELFAGEDGNRSSSAKGFSRPSPPIHAEISPVAPV